MDRAERAPDIALVPQLLHELRRAGWSVERKAALHKGPYGPDFVLRKDDHLFFLEIKPVSEMRGDRLIPLFAQAVLEATAYARTHSPSARPLVVFGSRRRAEPVVDRLRRFADQFAPHVAFGVMDVSGFRYFSDPSFHDMNVDSGRMSSQQQVLQRRQDLFSGLNQWMLKVLLAPRIPEPLLAAPRGSYRNVSELAKAADVTVMSAYRFVTQLRHANYLDDADRFLRLVRIQELMERWEAAAKAWPGRDMPARWIIGGRSRQLADALRNRPAPSVRKGRNAAVRPPVRMCLGLFAAAEQLGLGFVQGVAPHLYVERPDVDALRPLGLSPSEPGGPVDAWLRLASKPEAVFRAAVHVDGVPVSDVLQVWLDVQSHPARGAQQANEIRRRVLQPLFSGKER